MSPARAVVRGGRALAGSARRAARAASLVISLASFAGPTHCAARAISLAGSAHRASRPISLAGAARCAACAASFVISLASFAGPARCASRVASLLVVLAVLGISAPSRADLGDDAARLARMWSSPETRVARLPPVFVEHGSPRLVVIEPPPAGPEGAPGECVTVAFLAPRTVDFTLAPASSNDDAAALAALAHRLRGHDAEDDRRAHSVAGALSLTRCGPDRDELRRVILEVLSPRAAFEIVVAASSAAPERIEAVFPERVSGPIAPRGDPGRPAEPGPLSGRLARAARRARAEGAHRVVRTEMRASAAGVGQFTVKLPEGCHRLDILADVPSSVPRRATDVDAEAREAGSGRVLDRDRADAADARLDFCLGEAGVVEVQFLGAAGAVKVVLSDAQWPISPFVPAHFGARARAGLAAALARRHAPAPRAQTIVEAVGVQGETPVPVPVEPGRCYFAAAALVRGERRALRLFAEIGDRAARDDAGERSEGAGVAFCSDVEESAVLRVAARGSAPVWVLAVWPMD